MALGSKDKRLPLYSVYCIELHAAGSRQQTKAKTSFFFLHKFIISSDIDNNGPTIYLELETEDGRSSGQVLEFRVLVRESKGIVTERNLPAILSEASSYL